ncbi:MAG: TonB-dependent receptor [Cognaticolwellia sp.]
MKKNYKLAQSIRLALVAGATSSALFVTPNVFAEENVQEIERIEVTGSSIKRTDLEGSLPVTTISNEDIIRSGVTSVPDLIAQLPAMQGFTTASDSVGGGGGGVQSASLRDLGDSYTLVLLNGRRMASADSGGSIDLNSIPLAAIERVEVLTDGASALYGSDAIAGVVNFIMKKDLQTTNFHARYDRPQESGGTSYNFSVSTGYGDLSDDGFNIMLSYSHDEQEQLKSSERDFAKTGILPFSHNGVDLILQRTSANAIPGNAHLSFNNEADRSLNPYREANGQCAEKNAPQGSTCIYDFTETLEIMPESNRDNVFVQGLLALNDDSELFATASWSQFDLISRIAPYPTGRFTLPLDSSIVQENILPYLTEAELADGLSRVSAEWRSRPGGNRTTEWSTETFNYTFGIRGEISEIAYDLAFTYAESTREQNRITGFPIQEPFLTLLSSGQVNIFDTPENLDDSAKQAVADTMFSGNWDVTDTSMKAIEGKASKAIFELPAGDVYLGGGFDYREVEYKRTISQSNRDEIVLFESADPEFDLSRETYGMFLEAIVPVFDGFELTAAIRYDNIGKITDSLQSKAINQDENDTTYKVSIAYRPNDDWLVRASLGTGFKAPSMRQIAEPRVEFGVTSGAYACPFTGNDPLAQFCRAGLTQFEVFREGFAGLTPETSEQRSVGFVYSPSTAFSFNFDWWQVNLADQVQRLTQDQILNDAVTYRELYTTKLDKGTGDQVLAIIQAAVNIGESNNEGIDWGVNVTNELSFGTLKSAINGTYIIESESLRVGSENIFDTSLGKFGTNNAVTFRNIAKITNTLTAGDFAHSLNINYRSGYMDKFYPGGSTRIRLASDINTNYSGGTQLTVPSYMTVDYVVRYFMNDNLNINFGINNLLDKEPPLTLRTAGAGHQVGYDPRYSDAKGRTFYLTADYTF